VSLADKLQRVVAEYSPIDDLHERLAAVVDRARTLPPLAANERIDAHRVPGCVSIVWLVSESQGGRCHFRSDATSPLVRGLVAFLTSFYSGSTPAEILAPHEDPLAALGLERQLSPTRRNGLAAVRAAIHACARRSGG